MAYNNNIPSYQDLRALSIVWLRAIALAWEYRQPGKYDNDAKAKRFLCLLDTNVRQALAEYFNYQCPFSVNLNAFGPSLKRSPPLPVTDSAQWVPTQVGAGTVTLGHWEDLPPNQIVFHLPTPPAPPTSPSLMGDEAIAVAAYVDSGSNYLFSCC